MQTRRILYIVLVTVFGVTAILSIPGAFEGSRTSIGRVPFGLIGLCATSFLFRKDVAAAKQSSQLH